MYNREYILLNREYNLDPIKNDIEYVCMVRNLG